MEKPQMWPKKFEYESPGENTFDFLAGLDIRMTMSHIEHIVKNLKHLERYVGYLEDHLKDIPQSRIRE